MFIKSPPEQYSSSKINLTEISEEVQPLSEAEIAIIAFDDTLGSSNSNYIDQLFIRGRHNNLDVYYLTQSYFDFPKRKIRNKNKKLFPLLKL